MYGSFTSLGEHTFSANLHIKKKITWGDMIINAPIENSCNVMDSPSAKAVNRDVNANTTNVI